MRRGRRLLPILLALVASLLLAPPAHAGKAESLAKLLKDYAPDQKISACKYTLDELRQLRDLIPNDADQYAPDLRAKLSDAIDRRAAGDCTPGGKSRSDDGAVTPAPPTGGGTGKPAAPKPKATPGVAQAPPAPSAQPAPAPAVSNDAIQQAARLNTDGSSDTPAALVALALLAGLMLLSGAAYGVARWWAWEPFWLVRLRHATAEAGWRASSTWAEFTDFVRFGR